MLRMLGALAWCLGLAACGGGREQALAEQPSASAGQVAAAAPAKKLTFYAASRFAEQATFGPTPALVAELQAKGIERWIDEQFLLPPTQSDTTPALITGNPIPPAPYLYQKNEYQRLILASPDQLRARVTWSLSQFITVSGSTGHPVSLIDWVNMLQRQAFGNYGDLLYQVSTHPMMAQYLNNNQNRPKSAECPNCAPNENFARELLQLFALGVQLLNVDGTPVRNARGAFVETYSQTDVEELARVLTGWEHPYNPLATTELDKLVNYALKPMRPTTWPPLRDSGAKRVLDRSFPAGRTQQEDLQDTVVMLMRHQNVAPFVSLRLIQHLVKSNPTPAYLARVAAVFRNNGNFVAGDIKAVLKAVLLDAEARAGDDPTRVRTDDGKIREPALHRSAIFRSWGCTRGVTNNINGGYWLPAQPHLHPESVFSFYAPTDRAPGSNLLAPEQKLITSAELTARLGELNWLRYNQTTRLNDLSAFTNSGCNTAALMQAFNHSPRAFSDHLSRAYFRGAMPPTLAQHIEQALRNPALNTSSPEEGAMRMLGFALATPYFGVIK